jgi:glycosyltransferase EpsD
MDRPLPECANTYDLPFARVPWRTQNLSAYRQLRRVLRDGQYDAVHCHTPVGGLLGRWAARGTGAKVLYTAHGFHFYRGAPLLNWLLYYPLERILARRTDVLITINDEDEALARQKFPAGRVARVHGVGVDMARFAPVPPVERMVLRVRLGLPPEDPVLLCVAELNANKQQSLLVRAMPSVLTQFPRARLLLAGPDHFGGRIQALARELRVSHAVTFLGERGDVPQLLAAADVVLAASLREGLPVNVMEAMAAGLPVIATDNRGHRELIRPEETGLLVPPTDACAMAGAILRLLGDPALRARMGQFARDRAENYALPKVLAELMEIYQEI